ncbi:hypothetical protein LJK88_06075 [Paenibacillus sp. P26]|nr:hypothetical protein LJK88_06075 [Paenibacillus sp. P26]
MAVPLRPQPGADPRNARDGAGLDRDGAAYAGATREGVADPRGEGVVVYNPAHADPLFRIQEQLERLGDTLQPLAGRAAQAKAGKRP